MSIALGSGNELKQRSVLGAGDSSTDGARETGGLGGLVSGVVARLAIAIGSSGVTGATGGVGGIGGISPRDPLHDPGIIEH